MFKLLHSPRSPPLLCGALSRGSNRQRALSPAASGRRAAPAAGQRHLLQDTRARMEKEHGGKEAAIAPQPEKCRLLCLHGYGQNASVFRARTGALRRALRTRCDFVFVDGPLPAALPPRAPSPPGAGGTGGQGGAGGQGRAGAEEEAGALGWWQAADLSRSVAPAHPTTYTGWRESVEGLRRYMDDEGPFHGVLGFSQGATLAALLAARPSAPLHLAILISGFVPRDPAAAEELAANVSAVQATPGVEGSAEPGASGGCATRTLHVCGRADAVVPRERSMELAALFGSTASVFEHDLGHCIPSGSAAKTAFRAFVDDAMVERTARSI